MATIAELLEKKVSLSSISDSAALDVELLLAHCLDKPRSFLRAWPEKSLDAVTEENFLELLQRRQQGEPIAYLIGSRGFWTLDLEVSPSTLIPRPETELLVEQALHCGTEYQQASVLDLGTGTGAIALAIASEKPEWQVLGCDRQDEAVQLAERNRQKLNLNNAQFLQSDWFSAIPPQAFQLIVSNPPYIDPEDQHLDQGDVRFEPRSALVADHHGLADLEQIVEQSPDYLNTAGWLLLEHGFDQGEAVAQLMTQAGFAAIQTLTDLAGHDRVTMGQKA